MNKCSFCNSSGRYSKSSSALKALELISNILKFELEKRDYLFCTDCCEILRNIREYHLEIQLLNSKIGSGLRDLQVAVLLNGQMDAGLQTLFIDNLRKYRDEPSRIFPDVEMKCTPEVVSRQSPKKNDQKKTRVNASENDDWITPKTPERTHPKMVIKQIPAEGLKRKGNQGPGSPPRKTVKVQDSGFLKRASDASRDVKGEASNSRPNRTCPSTQKLIENYDKPPQTRSNAFAKTVRNKDQRAKMSGWSCDVCKNYYTGQDLSPIEIQKRKNSCSRHRSHQSLETNTPPDFWDTRVPSTQDAYEQGYIRIGQASPTPPPRKYDLLEHDL